MEKRLLVIQEHNAKRAGLHWDVRFEKYENEFENEDIDSYISKRSSNSNEPMSTTMKKSLLSFVIPKHEFPSNGKVRMAIKVEDHIWEYKDFDGTIESGYGAGEVKIIFNDYVNVQVFTNDKIVFEFNKKWYTIFKTEKNYLIKQTKI
jgi:hypothetical protein